MCTSAVNVQRCARLAAEVELAFGNDVTIRAKSFILSTGGFAFNRKMVRAGPQRNSEGPHSASHTHYSLSKGRLMRAIDVLISALLVWCRSTCMAHHCYCEQAEC